MRRAARPLAAAAASPAATAHAPRPLAAACIIGNELLTGKVTDTNTPLLARTLFARGVVLDRVEMVRDDRAVIARAVQSLSAHVGPSGFVFTSGGIGPTHDDVTYEGVAAAFGVGLATDEGVVERMRAHGMQLNEARLRMARFPEGAELLDCGPRLWVPIVKMRNVYVLPGIPKLFEKMLAAHAHRFGSGAARATREHVTGMREGDLAEGLARVQAEHPAVEIGSYPIAPATVRITVDGDSEEEVEAVVAEVRRQFPSSKL